MPLRAEANVPLLKLEFGLPLLLYMINLIKGNTYWQGLNQEICFGVPLCKNIKPIGKVDVKMA